ncbi:hypothetical protein [Rhodoplanes azumiensis]|uniref:Uncharacterized protein n=1 Tax=Rhodoplanes azumiensis TaxID=1897628 RepID=A0ABW5AN09_9BRAD
MTMNPPPRDDNGHVVPHDHDGIDASHGVIRRISELQIVTDKAGQRRISSLAFKPSGGSNGGMSVDLEESIRAAGLDPYGYVTTPRWTGSVKFVVGDLRNENFKVGFNPLPENPHHGEVWGDFGRAKQRRLQTLARWFVPIEGVIIAVS